LALSFFLDEDLSYRVAEGLRRVGIDAVSATELGRSNRRLPDQQQLEYAAAEGRVLVTYNRADYQTLDIEWRNQGLTHPGILWCVDRSIPRHAIGELVRAVEAVAAQYESLDGICMLLPRPRT
jgi:predicted nuclease of predicted toxin-antitoxin system